MDIEIKNAIVSVSDKRGLERLVRKLHKMNVSIFSTGGTASAIEGFDIPVKKIAAYTGFPEILDGRVKSLHPKIHGGILARRDDKGHMKQLDKAGIIPFDMVVINLYPFEQVIRREGVTIDEAVENIDIGGPSMLRSAAKNYHWVCVVPDPEYYDVVIKELEEKGRISLSTRERLAMATFEKTSYYDSIINSYFHNFIVNRGEVLFADTISLFFKKREDLRYGENPHQRAAFYTSPGVNVSGVAGARKLHGKQLSFNNILDTESAFELVKDFKEPACCIVKHNNPCGAAMAQTLRKAFVDALECDPVSAFGGIVGFNRIVDRSTAVELAGVEFVECIIAPEYEEIALSVLSEKKNLRILETGSIPEREVYDYDMKRVIGGVLVQERDLKDITTDDLKTVTIKSPAAEQIESLLFAWKIVKHVKSNAIVLAQGTRTVGIGAGQMSRVDSTFIALKKAGERAKGAVLASDAFFPRDDAVKLAAEHGVVAIIQPGGSVRDEEVIKACDDAGIAMVFTGMRHFKH